MARPRTRHPCCAPDKLCAGRLRRCFCLKETILELCADAPSPPTTGQLVRGLGQGPIDIYALLFAMELEGLVECHRTAPWTWCATERGEGVLGRS